MIEPESGQVPLFGTAALLQPAFEDPKALKAAREEMTGKDCKFDLTKSGLILWEKPTNLPLISEDFWSLGACVHLIINSLFHGRPDSRMETLWVHQRTTKQTKTKRMK